jgi:hypothetical protein
MAAQGARGWGEGSLSGGHSTAAVDATKLLVKIESPLGNGSLALVAIGVDVRKQCCAGFFAQHLLHPQNPVFLPGKGTRSSNKRASSKTKG